MTNLQIEDNAKEVSIDHLDLHEDVLIVKGDFLKHLFGVLNPDEEIEALKRIRVANDDIELSEVA